MSGTPNQKPSQIPRLGTASVKPKVVRVSENPKPKVEEGRGPEKKFTTGIPKPITNNKMGYASAFIAKKQAGARTKTKLKPIIKKPVIPSNRGNTVPAPTCSKQPPTDSLKISDIDINVLMSPKSGTLGDCLSRTPFDEPKPEAKLKQVVKKAVFKQIISSPVFEEDDYMNYADSGIDPFFDGPLLKKHGLPIESAADVDGIHSIGEITPPKEIHEVVSDPTIFICDEQPPHLATSLEDLLSQDVPNNNLKKASRPMTREAQGDTFGTSSSTLSEDLGEKIKIHAMLAQDYDTESAKKGFHGLEITSSFVMDPDTEDEEDKYTFSKNDNASTTFEKVGSDLKRPMLLEQIRRKTTIQQNLHQLETEMLPFMLKEGLRVARCLDHNDKENNLCVCHEILIPSRITLCNKQDAMHYMANVIIRNNGDKSRIFKIQAINSSSSYDIRPEYGIIPPCNWGTFVLETILLPGQVDNVLCNGLEVMIADASATPINTSLEEYWKNVEKINRFRIETVELMDICCLAVNSLSEKEEESVQEMLTGHTVDEMFYKSSKQFRRDAAYINSKLKDISTWGSVILYLSSLSVISAICLKNFDDFVNMEIVSPERNTGLMPRLFNSFFGY